MLKAFSAYGEFTEMQQYKELSAELLRQIGIFREKKIYWGQKKPCFTFFYLIILRFNSGSDIPVPVFRKRSAGENPIDQGEAH